jgi:DMSO/TMAO reductase YedYZ molybdopterin-dependent catalytic subunit
MKSNKRFLVWASLAVGVIIVFLAVSCSQITSAPPLEPSPPPASSSTPESPASTPAETTPILVTGLGIPIETYQDLGRLSGQDPAGIDNSGFPLTPVEELHVTGSIQTVDIAGYHLEVDGLVDRPLALSYEELRQLTPVTRAVLLICPGFFVDNAEWTGVPVKDILTQAGLQPGAKEVHFYSVDGYDQTLTLEEARAEGVILAYQVNGRTLPEKQGYPLRLVIEGKYGSLWVKWLGRIEVK